ncbi:MAG TPA: cytochrome c [Polyangiaceae bacterium]|nr:cytochrome c [Polyangiaceae bacterium]
MRRHRSTARSAFSAFSTSTFGAGLLLLACERPAADLREWRVSDHDHTSNPNATQVEVKPDAGSPLGVQGVDEVTIVTWKENCAKCHGTVGAGDGPQGPMTHARDLTSPEWQAATTDATIAQSIRDGRGRMPAFKLPDSTVASLVRLVRLFDARKRGAAVGEP